MIPVKAHIWMLPILPLFFSCDIAFCQQLAFTSRTYVQAPVVIVSIASSKEFGFDSVVLRNDGPDAIAAVHLQLTFQSGAGDELAGERRIAVSLEPRDSKRLIVELAHIEGLKQLAKSRKASSALVIITIESVEFQNGGEWKQTEREHGIPLDPARPVEQIRRK